MLPSLRPLPVIDELEAQRLVTIEGFDIFALAELLGDVVERTTEGAECALVEVFVRDAAILGRAPFLEPRPRLVLLAGALCHLIQCEDAARLVGVAHVTQRRRHVGAQLLDALHELRVFHPVIERARRDGAIQRNFIQRQTALEDELQGQFFVCFVCVPSPALRHACAGRRSYCRRGSVYRLPAVVLPGQWTRRSVPPPHPSTPSARPVCLLLQGAPSRASLASISHQVHLCKVQVASAWDEWASGSPCVHRASGSGHRGGRAPCRRACRALPCAGSASPL